MSWTRTPVCLQALAERLEGQSGRLIPKKLDMSKEDEITEIFAWIEKELGGVDVLVNNAAVVSHKPFHGKTNQEVSIHNVFQRQVFNRSAVNRFCL